MSRRLLLFLVLVLVGFWGCREGQQWLARLRAERLLKDVQALEVDRSSWADAQHLMTHWGKWGKYSGSCDQARCQYFISLDQDHPRWMYVNEDGLLRLHLRALLDLVGLRRSVVHAAFGVRNGVVASKFFSVDVDTPLRWRGPYLTVSSGEGPRLFESEPDDRVLHPYRSIEDGKYFTVQVTPKENAAERAKLMRFQLDCLTVVRPCFDRSRILPEAYEELRGQSAAVAKIKKGPEMLPYWVIARDEETVLIADVISAKLQTQFAGGTVADPSWVIRVQARRVLKGPFSPIEKLFFIDPLLKEEIACGSPKWFCYQSLLIAGRPIADADDQELMGPIADYYVVGNTPANLAAAQRGVREDYASETQRPW